MSDEIVVQMKAPGSLDDKAVRKRLSALEVGVEGMKSDPSKLMSD